MTGCKTAMLTVSRRQDTLGGGGVGCLQPGSFPRNEVAAEPQEVVPSSLTATSESGDMSWPQLLKVLEFDPKVMVVWMAIGRASGQLCIAALGSEFEIGGSQ